MDVGMLDAALQALSAMMEFERLGYLFAGVIVGLLFGILPGVGGIAGMALLLPFTFNMDAYSAFAFLLGLGAVTSTGDTIPAVLFGVPGTSASQAAGADDGRMHRSIRLRGLRPLPDDSVAGHLAGQTDPGLEIHTDDLTGLLKTGPGNRSRMEISK